MTQMWLLWWPKTTNSAVAATTVNISGTTMPPSSPPSSSSACFSCKQLSKLMKKLGRNGKKMLRGSRQSKSSGNSSGFQCRYDPLSYALNFDSSGCGSFVDDHQDYYYKFYAFSSRFVANTTTSSSSCSSSSCSSAQ